MHQTLVERVVKAFSTATWRLTIISLQFVLLGGAAFVIWQGKATAMNVIAKSPAVIQANKDLTALKDDLAETKDALTKDIEATTAASTQAKDKAEQSLATQSKIFDRLSVLSDTGESIKISLATLTEHVSGLETRFDRVEARQDRIDK